MQGRTLKIAAAVLLVMALLIGWYGVTLSGRTSTQASAPAVSVSKPVVTVWAFASDVPKQAVLTEDMLVATQVTDATAEDIRDYSPFIGRQLKLSVVKGTRLKSALLLGQLPIAQSLPQGYRAIAIQASELTTVGGHVHPGYRVDVIYLLRANKESGDNSTARRILSNVEVLAVGDQLNFDSKKTEKQINDKARTVVLAVPATDTPQLLLAETTGQLRLAVVGTQELAPAVELTADTESMMAYSPVPDQPLGTNQKAGVIQAPKVIVSSQKTASTSQGAPAVMMTAPSHSTIKEPEDVKQDDSYVISLKTLGGYREAEVEVKKPTPVKYRYVAPRVEVFQGENRTLVRTSH
ncbi:Flp pilus assembly protein CpaB [Photobacterium sp. WH77]|uniref:Flp pilus assembly protein CpaB n=1 Tax=Photobacterium TaxID=657 RepID=UPI001EDA1FFC|nr:MULTISPECIES: Flp pilus assembly protein CpaB [Photobacterium]MCG2837849.1 Flp pilus assembly protein CpaB [Photobacterium sp. WH77]MCG2845467.1 Flp pilus assembly protein CpaB [Photobacterium sp. WH80]